jgi:aminomethyltransferase
LAPRQDSPENPLDTGAPIKKTPLNDVHRAAGARMVEFAGWDMPVQYTGVMDEHLAVRTKAGLFDVSHMGEITIEGPRALDSVQHLTCNDASKLSPGQAQYTAFTTGKGTFVDDVIVYRRAEDRFFICVNAGNEPKDFAWVQSHVLPGATARNLSSEYAQIAIQGPRAVTILRGIAEADVEALKPFTFVEGAVSGVPGLIARTGYTGEDGFEIYCPAGRAAELWSSIMKAGATSGLVPCGLGARDTLRLEACLMLYGNDIDETTTVLEAGINFILKLSKGDFIGRDALVAQKERGVERKLAAFEMVERGIARHGYPAAVGGRMCGHVTSGTFAPYLRKNIGMAYLPADSAGEGAEFDVIIRGNATRARVVRAPFYKRRAS